MFSKAVAVLPLAASLLEQANAFSFHRHQHQVEKRAVVYHTVYHTVYVTAGAESPAEAQPTFVADKKPALPPAAQTVTVDASPEPAPAAITQQDAPPAPAAITQQDAPPALAAPTTLSTAVKADITLPNIGDLLPTKSASSSPSTPSGGAPFSSKRGIAYNDASMANTFKGSCKACGWAYNWGSSAPGLDSDINYVPLLWGDKPVHTDHWHQDAETALGNGAKALLSFNEPDMPSQADMSPQAAAAAHKQYFSRYTGRAEIGAPAVSNSNLDGQGIQWLKQFMAACGADCPVTFCPVHWYSPASADNTLFDHLEAAKEACKGMPIWLTEFAPTGSDAEISDFVSKVIPKLDSLDYLHAYSYFMVGSNGLKQHQLMSSVSDLSAIGSLYASAK